MLTDTNRAYWNRRAESYTNVIQKNLAEGWDSVWADSLTEFFPQKDNVKVLDIGTGPGFYSIILAERGYDVTAIDFSEEMLNQAKQNAGELSSKIDFRQMDAQNLSFDDGEFDVIVSRNLTWNLPDPEKAYKEWYRVLKTSGVMLNFDANWYSYLVDDEKKEAFEHDRENVRLSDFEDHEAYSEADKMEDISRQLPLTGCSRQGWDLGVLSSIGFAGVDADTEFGEKVWNEEEKLNYASTPGFLIKAVK